MFLRKVLNNFGTGSLQVLGLREYFKYLATALLKLPQVLASRSLRPIDMEKLGTLSLRHPVTRARVKIDLDSYKSRDMEEGPHVWWNSRVMDAEYLLREFELPGRLKGVIDLGANRGLFRFLAASMADHVVAVEALDEYRTAMLRNLAINDLHNVTLINAFVCTPAMFDPRDGPIIELERVIEALGNMPIDFLKVDIEGSEFGLEIAQLQSIKRVAMELHRGWGDIEKFIGELRSCGFVCRTYDESLKPVESADADFVYGINRRFADVAWKKDR